ncbi:MAG: ParB/RepB/Spo0J family partition protein [Vulcanimicrobiaceae bacterium]
MQTLDLHPLCTLFPRLDGDAYADLVADIRANGLREPITLHDGMILDGGNRYRACMDAGIEPTFQQYAGDNLAQYVLSANLHRRHLSAGQRASIVSAVLAFTEAHPPHRIAATAQEGGNITPFSTRAKRAAASGASDPTQRDADRIQKADPELGKKVATGEITLAQAKAQVTGKERPKATKVRPREDGEPEPFTQADELQNARAQISELQDIIAAQEHELEAFRTLAEGDQAVALEIKILKDQVRTLTLARDSYMTKSGELIREVKSLRRKLGLK